MDKLIAILDSLGKDADFAVCQTLVDDGVLDSFDIVTLIAEINDEFDITVPPEEVIPENFNSAPALWDMIQRLQ